MASEQENLAAALKDIVRYEQKIGELLSTLEAKDRLLADQQSERQQLEMTARHQWQSAMLRMVQRQNSQLHDTYELLARLLQLSLQGAAPRRENRKFALFGRNRQTEAPALLEHGRFPGRLVTALFKQLRQGEVGEKLVAVHFDFTSGKRYKAVRTTVEFVRKIDGSGRSGLKVAEEAGLGVHSIVLSFPDISVPALRSAYVEVKSDGVENVKIRLREQGGAKKHTSCKVSLQDGAFGGIEPEASRFAREITVEQLSDGWYGVTFAAPIGGKSQGLDFEIIAVPDFTTRTSQSDGVPGKAFMLRNASVYIAASPGAAPPEISAAPLEGAAAQDGGEDAASSSEKDSKRDTARSTYLGSPSYARIAALRNRHLNSRAFIVGNGPSVRTQDLTLLRNETTFVTNWFVNHEQYEDIFPTYYCVSSHEMFGGWNNPTPQLNQDWVQAMLTRAPATRRFFSFEYREYVESKGIFPIEHCEFLLFDSTKRLVDRIGDINLDLSRHMDDGYTGIITFCIPLAVHMGVKEIYLLGCDSDYGIKPDSHEKEYFYDYALHATATTKTDNLRRIWSPGGPVFQAYEVVKRRLDIEGVRVFNCTAGGKLDVFPRVEYESLFPGAR